MKDLVIVVLIVFLLALVVLWASTRIDRTPDAAPVTVETLVACGVLASGTPVACWPVTP